MAWLLVQRSLTPPEIEPVQRAFQATGIFHALDAVSFVRDAFGVLAKGLSDDEAHRLQNALAVQGVEVDVIDEADWPALPPAKRIVRAACWAESFAPLDPLGRELNIPWDQIVAVCAGLVREVEFGKRVTAIIGRPAAPLSGRNSLLMDVPFGVSEESFGLSDPLPADRLVLTGEERNWRWVAEVILAGGLRFVWQAQEFNYHSLGARATRNSAVDLGIFLRDLISAVPNAVLNRGAFAIRENLPESGPRYPTRNAFSEETAWLLWRLRRVGRYVPIADA